MSSRTMWEVLQHTLTPPPSERRTHRVELGVDVGGLVSSQNQDPGRHVARVLAGHQDGQLSAHTSSHF